MIILRMVIMVLPVGNRNGNFPDQTNLDTSSAASALTGPAVVSANVAKSGVAVLARAGINAVGTQASQIVHNEFFDEGTYPHPGELAGGAGLGAGASYVGELADKFVTGAVTVISGKRAVGEGAGMIAYNLAKNFGSSYYVNQGANWMDCVAEGGSCAN